MNLITLGLLAAIIARLAAGHIHHTGAPHRGAEPRDAAEEAQ